MMAQALKYTGCMRSHGVPSFPDPKQSSGGISIGGPGLDPTHRSSKRLRTTAGPWPLGVEPLDRLAIALAGIKT